MKAITWLASFSAVALSSSAFAEVPKGWSTDLDAAIIKAKVEKKSVLIDFTGSDWCPPCMVMKKKVFSKPEFIKPASKNFVLVQLDLPNGDKALAEKNRPHAEKFKIEGFPTTVLLDSEGKEFTRFSATQFPTVEEFLKRLNQAVENQQLD